MKYRNNPKPVSSSTGIVSGTQYHKDKNGRWRDNRGRFVSKSIAEKR